jgi:curli production assembly/transport component CsgF
MFETGSETLSSPETIAANDDGLLASRRIAPGSRFRGMSRILEIVEAIKNNVSVLPARNSFTYRHLLAYRAGLRLMIFSRILGQHRFYDALVKRGIGQAVALLFNFQRGCIMGTIRFSAAGLLAGILLSSSAFATEQIYRPVSPTFGGNALNGNFLLSTAQAQGKGTKSGQQGPDLSGLNDALSGIGGNSQQPVIIIGGSGQTTIPSSP